MSSLVDFTFVSKLEGGMKTAGYVPSAATSKSGVTIATGFDLGQRSKKDLELLRLDLELQAKLVPYLGVKKNEAVNLLKTNPLWITKRQALAIDKAVKSTHLTQLRLRFDLAARNKRSFIDLPAKAQTVIYSVSYQYGIRLDLRTPKFWKAVTSEDWPEAVRILNSFGDKFPRRRKKEAALLEKISLRELSK